MNVKYGVLLLAVVVSNGAAVAQTEDRFPREAPTLRKDSLGDALPAKAKLRLGTRRFQHPSGPAQIILSRDESLVFSIDEDHLIAWDSSSGEKLWQQPMSFRGSIRVSAAGYGIKPLAIAPDSGELITPAGRTRIAFWDVKQGEPRTLAVGLPLAAKSIDISPDGKLLALGTNQELLVCDREGEEVYRIRNPNQPLMQRGIDRDRLKFGGDFSYGRFSPNGELLVLVHSSKPNTMQLFEATTGKRLREIEGGNRIVRMDFSPDSTMIVTTERDISARLYDIQTGEQLWEYIIKPPNAAESYTSDVAFRPDGKQIAVGTPIGSDYTIRLLDAESGKETAILYGSQWKPWTLQYRSDSQMLYSSGWDGVIRQWTVDSNEQLLPPGGSRATGICATSRDGQHVAFADDRRQIHLVDVETGKTLKKFSEADIVWGQIVFSYDGSRLVAGGSSELRVHVIVWDLETNEKLHHWDWGKGRDTHSNVEALSISANGQRVAAAVFRQDAAYVWDLPTDQQIAKVKHTDVYGLDIDAAGKRIITGGWDKTLRIWDCDLGVELAARLVEDNGKDTRMYGVKLSNDQTMIATIDMTESIRLYDRELDPISNIEKAGWFTFGALKFSPNDRWIGVGSGGGATLFDVHSGAKLWTVDEHEEYIYTVDFGPRNNTFLSGGSDGVCYLWGLDIDVRVPMKDSERLIGDELFGRLASSDPRLSFAAYQGFLMFPEQALEFLATKLFDTVDRDLTQSDLKKWIVALGADDQNVVNAAVRKLTDWGPPAYELLEVVLQSPDLTQRKRDQIERVRETSLRQFRMLAELVADLESPDADEVLAQLLEKTRTEECKAIVARAHRRRTSTVDP